MRTMIDSYSWLNLGSRRIDEIGSESDSSTRAQDASSKSEKARMSFMIYGGGGILPPEWILSFLWNLFEEIINDVLLFREHRLHHGRVGVQRIGVDLCAAIDPFANNFNLFLREWGMRLWRHHGVLILAGDQLEKFGRRGIARNDNFPHVQ